jgi:hypothetical protein
VKLYFENFPLKTKKKQRYFLWCELFSHIEKKDHLNPLVLGSLIEKAKNMNKKEKISKDNSNKNIKKHTGHHFQKVFI